MACTGWLNCLNLCYCVRSRGTMVAHENTRFQPLISQMASPKKNKDIYDEPSKSMDLQIEDCRYIDETTDCDELQQDLGELEYEEVKLERNEEDRLGLTICYTSTEDFDTDVFIGEVQRDSVAARTGRIRAGDQILQINGVDVHTRNQTINLFNENRKDFTLLIARSSPERENCPPICTIEEENFHIYEDPATLSCTLQQHEHDSGISRLSGESEGEYFSAVGPPETSPVPSTSLPPDPFTGHPRRGTRASMSPMPSSSIPNDSSAIDVEPKTLLSPADAMSTTPSDPSGPCVRTVPRPLSRSGSDGSLACELAKLNREMISIQLECDRLVDRYAKQEQRVRQKVEQANEFVSTLDSKINASDRQVKFRPPPGPPRASPILASPKPNRRDDTSSAYNTGPDSCRSTPLHGSGSRKARQESPKPTVPPHRTSRGTPPRAPAQELATPTIYTHPENLEAAIVFQQRMFRQAMLAQAQNHLKRNPANALATQSADQAGDGSGSNMEWKVKRRSDGSRYITRRPVRNKLLKERAARLSDERQGLTTDDDAASELKVGRYWNRMERKRQFERAKERKIVQQEFLRRRAELGTLGESDLKELMDRKLAKRKNQQFLDQFTTIQEFLAHGTRCSAEEPNRMGILTVTTV